MSRVQTFYRKHMPSMQTIVYGLFAATSELAKMRTAAEVVADDHNAKDMRKLARQLDECCAQMVKLVARLPKEIFQSIYEQRVAESFAAPAMPVQQDKKEDAA